MATLSFSIIALHLFAALLERQPTATLFIATSLTTCLALLVTLPSILIGIPMLSMAWEKYGARCMLRRELWALAAFSLVGPPCLVHPRILHKPRPRALPPLRFRRNRDRELGVVSGRIVPDYYNRPHAFSRGGDGCRDHRAAPSSIWPRLPLVAHSHHRVHCCYGAGEPAPVVSTADGLCGCGLGRSGLRFHYAQIDGAHEIKDSADRVELPIFCGARISLVYLYVTPLYAHHYPWLWSLGRELNRCTPPDALVIVADYGDPRAIYSSKRKGWHFPQDGLLKGNPRNTKK
jgi:hypothetical protein